MDKLATAILDQWQPLLSCHAFKLGIGSEQDAAISTSISQKGSYLGLTAQTGNP